MSMLGEGEHKNSPEVELVEHQNTRSTTPISREEQLKRNRESAKHSRERRKEYLEALEARNTELLRKI